MRKIAAKKQKGSKVQRPYVGDTAITPKSTADKLTISLPVIVFALLIGLVIGMLVWAVFWLSTFLTNLLWTDALGALRSSLDATPLGSWWIPIAVCGLGGALIGVFTKHFGGAPEDIQTVMGQVKATGGYRLEKPGASILGFLLPLVFGGSIGPEAGLTGIIAAAVTKVGTLLRSAGLKAVAVADVTVAAVVSSVFGAPLAGVVMTAQDAMPTGEDAPKKTLDPNAYDFRRGAKITLYLASSVGAAAGIMIFTAIFGSESGLPRFEGITPGDVTLVWAIPCMIAGYAGALLYHTSQHFLGAASKSLKAHPVLKPVIAGVVLGTVAAPLPLVMFPGEAQSFELMATYQQLGFGVLIATGLAKCVITPLCLNFGWRGGHLFPVIFGGIACGYAIAILSGIDPMFCVAITTATLVAGVQRNPLGALALLLLCFPVKSLIWMAGACLIGSYLPMPFAGKDHS